MMLWKMAWRNLWRNRRRTLITISAIAFAVLWSVVLSSIQTGTWDSIIDNMSRFYLGYGQIHTKGFWGEQSLDLAFDPEAVYAELSDKLPSDVQLIPRLESFALASYGLNTKGVLVLGFDTRLEEKMTNLRANTIRGHYPEPDDFGVLVGDKLAEKLNLDIHDSIVLVGQGYHGQNAVGKYPVLGIIHMRSPEINKQIVAMPLPTAQAFYGTGALLTALAVNVPSRAKLASAIDLLKANLDSTTYEVMDYNELIPELIDAAKLDVASAKLILYILYMLISFGLLGTIIMMTKERSYEFGVMTAIGTEKSKLAGILWIESVSLALLGAVLGILLCMPIVYYLHIHPIQLTGTYAETYERFGLEPLIHTAMNWGIFLKQALVMFIIATILSMYPVIQSFRLHPLKAMRS
ncbi:MAG: ABC transporter permease [Saprospiraceae bacterium]|nr:ABC transporter permease [Saprospiraceae bacterium]